MDGALQGCWREFKMNNNFRGRDMELGSNGEIIMQAPFFHSSYELANNLSELSKYYQATAATEKCLMSF